MKLRTGQEVSLLEGIEQLRQVDGWDKTRLVKEALAEYIFRHHPGNPGLPLTHWTTAEPFSVAAKEKLAPKPLEPSMPDYKNMTVEQLEQALKKRFLSDFDRVVINFFLKKKEAHLT